MLRSWRLVVACLSLAVVAQCAGAFCDEPTEPSETGDAGGSRAQREAQLGVMRERAAEIEVHQMSSSKRQLVPLHKEPVFRYTDQPRGFIDATLWCWVARGRPVALSKVEALTSTAGAQSWQFCAASLAETPIEMRFPGGRRLSASRSGITLSAFDEAPEPGDRPTARLRQMKDLIARFAATIHVDGKDSLKQEMRLLPHPIFRYADAEGGIVDGVIFGLTTNGTNPDMLIVIELCQEGNAGARWKYGIAKMTAADVHIRLDQKEIYSSPLSEPMQTWTYFQMPRREKF